MQKLIPPLFLFISILVIIFLHIIFPVKIIIPSPYNYLGIILIISGLMIAKTVERHFSKIGTEIHTFKDPEKLVTDGFFQYSRNPVYLCFVIVLLGLNILLGSLTPFVVMVVFIVVTNFWYIPFEEKKCRNNLYKNIKIIKKTVRRWI